PGSGGGNYGQGGKMAYFHRLFAQRSAAPGSSATSGLRRACAPSGVAIMGTTPVVEIGETRRIPRCAQQSAPPLGLHPCRTRRKYEQRPGVRGGLPRALRGSVLFWGPWVSRRSWTFKADSARGGSKSRARAIALWRQIGGPSHIWRSVWPHSAAAEGITRAGSRPRQQCRSSPQGAQEEDAARGHLPRDE